MEYLPRNLNAKIVKLNTINNSFKKEKKEVNHKINQIKYSIY